MSLLHEQEKIRQAGLDLKAKVAALLVGLPDNPRINKLSKNCFTIKASDLGDNWTPEHHDFRVQYTMIAKAVEQRPADKIFDFLADLVETGKLSRAKKNSLNLHPDVVCKLAGLMEDM